MTLKIKDIVLTQLKKPRNFLIFVGFLLLPLLFIGTLHSHDWGDDFAQYIHQAGNLVKGISQAETGFVYSQKNYIGPQAYPMGFPLLLAPVYAITGNSITAFILLISVFYLLMGIFIFLFYKNYFSQPIALLLMLILIYNPQMLLFKREVMSDIPFTVILVACFILHSKLKGSNYYHYILLALLTGFLLILRPAGIVFVFALLTHLAIEMYRNRENVGKSISIFFIIALVPLFLYFGVNSFYFGIPSGGSINDYLLFYYSGDYLKVIPENFSHHLQVFRYMFEPESGVLKGFSVLLGSAILTFSAIGFFTRLVRKPQIVDWFFIYYVIMLLLFPNNNSGFRLMIPLGFIVLLYAAWGVKQLSSQSLLRKHSLIWITSLMVFSLYLPGIFQITRSQHFILEGPQQSNAKQAFEHIGRTIPKNEVVVFAKPRALALYAGCISMCDPFTSDPTLIHTEILKANGKYLLVHKSLTKENMVRYQRVMQHRLTLMWKNDDFQLLRINPVKYQ